MIRSFSAPQLAHWKSACGSISPGLVSRHFVISVNAMQPTLIKGRCACTGSIDWTCQATIATNSSCRMLYIGRIVASADASEKKSLSCMEKWENGPPCVRTVETAARNSVLLAQQAIVSREGRKVHPRERRPSRAPRGERGGMTLEKGGGSCFHSETDRLVASKPEASPVSRRGPLCL